MPCGKESDEERVMKAMCKAFASNRDEMVATKSFVDTVEVPPKGESFPDKTGDKNAVGYLRDYLALEFKTHKMDHSNITLLLRAIERVMCFGSIYRSVSKECRSLFDVVCDTIRHYEQNNTDSSNVVAAVNVLSAMVMRKWCHDDTYFDQFEQDYRNTFEGMDGFKLLAQMISSKYMKDKAVIQCLCEFFDDYLNHYRSKVSVSHCVKIASYLKGQMNDITQASVTSKVDAFAPLLFTTFLFSSESDVNEMQITMLGNGSFLHHLCTVVKGADTDNISYAYVVASTICKGEGNRVLSRCFPRSILNALELPMTVVYSILGMSKDYPKIGDESDRFKSLAFTSVVNELRKNWEAMRTAIMTETMTYQLFWTNGMRHSLSEKLNLEKEYLAARRAQSEGHPVMWDYEGFRMIYPELEKVPCVDGYIIQSILDTFKEGKEVSVYDPLKFVQHVYDSCVVDDIIQNKCAYLYIIYKIVSADVSLCRQFPLMRYICYLISQPVLDHGVRSQLLVLINVVLKHRANVEQFLDYDGLNSLSRVLVGVIGHMINQHRESLRSDSRRVQMEGSEEVVGEEKSPMTNRVILKPETMEVEDIKLIRIILSCYTAACESMPRIHSHLLQSPILPRLLLCVLFITDEEIINVVTKIVLASLATSPRAQQSVYISGIFHVLLYNACSSSTMQLSVAEFMRRYHLVQDVADVQSTFEKGEQKVNLHDLLANTQSDIDAQVEIAKKYSYLRFFLPQQLIALLVRGTPAQFAEVFNADSIESSDMLWNKEMRTHLSSCLQSMLNSYIRRIRKDYDSIWEYAIPTPVVYQNLESRLCVNNVLLDGFLQPSGTLPDTVKPVKFFEELVNELETRLSKFEELDSVEDQRTISLLYIESKNILCSMTKALMTKKEISRVSARAFTVIGRVFQRSLLDHKNLSLCDHALNVITEALYPADFGKILPVNVRECTDASGMKIFNRILEQAVDEQFMNTICDEYPLPLIVIKKALDSVNILATNSKSLEAVNADTSYLQNMTRFIDLKIVRDHPNLASPVLHAFISLFQSEKLIEVAISSGCLIFLIQICLCYEVKTPTDQEIVKSAEKCLSIFAGVAHEAPPPIKIVVDVMTQLLTPGLMKSMRKGEFLQDIRTKHIRTPLLIWNLEMGESLYQTLEHEEARIKATPSSRLVDWSPQSLLNVLGYRHTYSNLEHEEIVADVFLDVFIEQPECELDDPKPEQLLSALMISIVDKENTIKSFKSSEQKLRTTWMEGLSMNCRALDKLLEAHADLNSYYTNDSNLRKIFMFVKDQAIVMSDPALVDVLLSLLSKAASTAAGCDILASIIPDLSTILVCPNSAQHMVVFSIIRSFIEKNDDCVRIIMSNYIILVILNIIISYDENNNTVVYEDSVQDLAVITLGQMMHNEKYGQGVIQYMQTLFSPLFNNEFGYYNILVECDSDVSAFLKTIGDTYTLPNVLWDDGMRKDLRTFLLKEARVVRNSESAYDYEAAHVNDRYNPLRATLKSQLCVEQVFIHYYLDSPYECHLDAREFVNSLVRDMKKLQPIVKRDMRDSQSEENYLELAQALKLHLQTEKSQELEAEHYNLIISYYIKSVNECVEVGLDHVLGGLEYLINKPEGMAEIEANQLEEKGMCYPVVLLKSCTYQFQLPQAATRILKIIRTMMNASLQLMSYFYYSGILFYAFFEILTSLDDITVHDSKARSYLEIVSLIVSKQPEHEATVLLFLTNHFKGKLSQAPDILSLLLKKSHESPDENGKVRSWNAQSQSLIKDYLAQVVSKLNLKSTNVGPWDRKSDLMSYDGLASTWQRFEKTSSAAVPSTSSESTEIKRARPQPARS